MNNITAALDAANAAYVVRGAGSQRGDADLDLWIRSDHAERVIAALLEVNAAPIAGLTPSRPHHLTLAAPAPHGCQVVDLAIGPLSLGPYVVRDFVAVARDASGQTLSGASLIVDLLPRRLLAGKIPEQRHIEAARAVWSTMAPPDRTSLESEMAGDFGAGIASAVGQALESGQSRPLAAIARHARRRYLGALLRRPAGRRHLRRTLAGRLSVRPKPFGWPIRGTLVVLVGTDGTGKTTTATRVVGELNRLGMPARLRYFGRTRGNLPGVGALRDALERRDPSTAVPGPRPAPQRWHLLRRVGSWYYAFEYSARFWLTVFPSLAFGRTVVMDRFVYDLVVMPGGSPGAARVARQLVPHPEVVLYLDAPAGEIHDRKPERSVEAIGERQAKFADVVASLEHSTRYTVSTSRSAPDATARLVAAITMQAHRPHLPDMQAWTAQLGGSPDQASTRR